MSQLIIGKIEIEGGKAIKHFTSLRIRQSLFKHHEFKIVVPFEELEDPNELFFNKSYKDVVGSKITISFDSEYLEDAKSKFTYTFKGIVTGITLKNNGDLSNSFVIRGHSPTILMEGTQVKKTFFNMDVTSLISTLVKACAVNLLKHSGSAASTSKI